MKIAEKLEALRSRLLAESRKGGALLVVYPPEEEVSFRSGYNDGVRVNVAPVQRLGLLAADVLSKKDLKSLLAPEDRI